jgi:site-specific DNA-methyltransferase (adenine-specific)
MDKDLKLDNCQLMFGDCLERMKEIPDKSIDMILCDLPYGVLNKGNVNAKWDSVIPFDQLWKQYERIIKDNGAILLFGQGMFSAELMLSNNKLWRYNLIWDKVAKTGFLNANRMPLRQHEDIMLFYKKLCTYNPQMVKCEPHKRNHSKGNMKQPQRNNCYGKIIETPTIVTDEKFPISIISIAKEHENGKFYHPTQKPVALLEYLIKTYTNEGETVLDNTMGSGSTGVACVNTNRKFIGIELDEKYYDISCKRINEVISDKKQSLF